jgi:hypothetical protein
LATPTQICGHNATIAGKTKARSSRLRQMILHRV